MTNLTRDQIITIAESARERWANHEPTDRIRCAHAVLVLEVLSLQPPEWRVEVLWSLVRSIIHMVDEAERESRRRRPNSGEVKPS